jgi:hypothetical membrane protein
MGAPRLERSLLACGVIGPALFVAAFLAQGAVRPYYDPLRHPVSSLAIGDMGWVQCANFVVAGALLLAFAVGLRLAPLPGGGWWAPLLIGLVAIGLIGAGLFVADPIGGYPPGTPTAPVRTARGILHDLFSTPVFTAFPAACFVLAHRFAAAGRRGWAGYAIASGAAMLVAFVLSSMGFAQNAVLMPVGGLLQRLTLVAGLALFAAVAVHLLSRGRSGVMPREERESADP